MSGENDAHPHPLPGGGYRLPGGRRVQDHDSLVGFQLNQDEVALNRRRGPH